MPSSPQQQQQDSLQNIEVEVHYLSQALVHLKPNSQEWQFLRQKLEAAEEELEAMRQDQALSSMYPPNSPAQTLYSDSRNTNNSRQSRNGGSYRDDPGLEGYSDNVGYNTNGNGNGSGGHDHDGAYYPDSDHSGDDTNHHQYDDSSYAPVTTPINSGSRSSTPTRSNNRRRKKLLPATRPSSSATTGWWTNPLFSSRVFLVITVTVVVMMIAIVTFALTKSLSKNNTAAAANQQDDEQQQQQGQPYTGPCATWSMHLITDRFGNETSWKILQYDGIDDASNLRDAQESQGKVVLAGGPYSYKKEFDKKGELSNTNNPTTTGSHYEMVHANTCLPEGSYTFILYDVKGDGICCSYGRGEYGVNLSKGRVIRPLGEGKFKGNKQVTPFVVSADDIDILADTTSSTDFNNGGAPANTDTNSDITDQPCASFSMHLIPDQFGNETTWKIAKYEGVEMENLQDALDAHAGTVLLGGGPYEYKKQFDIDAIGSHYEMIQATTCLPIGLYTFILYDAKGDGICCDYGRGEYGINLSRGKVIRPLSLGKFSGAGQVTPFEVVEDDIDVHADLIGVSSSSGASQTITEPSDLLPDPSAIVNPEDPDDPCSSFMLNLIPDKFGNETTWNLMQQVNWNGDDGNDEDGEEDEYDTYTPTASPLPYGGRYLREEASPRRLQAIQEWTSVLSGGPYSYSKDTNNESAGSHYNAIIASTCLPVGLYEFILSDANANGICCAHGNGEYGITLSKGRVVRPLSQGRFTSTEEVTPFEISEDDIDINEDTNDGTPPLTSITNDPLDETYVVAPEPPPANHASDNEANNNTPNNAPSEIIFDDPSTLQHPATSINSLNSLVTVSSGGKSASRGKSYGIMFDVEASPSPSPIIIAGMDLFLDTEKTSHFEIWTKDRSWQDAQNSHEGNPEYARGFRQVAHGRITGNGESDFTKIALRNFQDIEVQGGHIQAFWVTLSDDNMIFESYQGEGITRHEMANVIQAEKNGLKVYYGAAIRAYPLELADPVTDYWYNSGFLGRLWYKTAQ